MSATLNGTAPAAAAPSSEPVRFCKDCKWVNASNEIHPSCLHPRANEGLRAEAVRIIGRNVFVSGEGVYCEIVRGYGTACGFEGKLFEPRPPPPPPPPTKSLRTAWAVFVLFAIPIVLFAYIAWRALARGAS